MTNSDFDINRALETAFLLDNNLMEGNNFVSLQDEFEQIWPYLVEDYLAEEEDDDNDF